MVGVDVGLGVGSYDGYAVVGVDVGLGVGWYDGYAVVGT